MSSDDFPRLIYLVLLVGVIGGYFLLENRQRLGKIAQQAAVWGLIFIGMAAGYGLWSDIRATGARQALVNSSGQIEVQRAADGHYYLTLEINGTPVDFMVDTGASDVVLTRNDARRVGIDPDTLDYIGQANTANGVVRTARVRLEDVALQGFDEGGFSASVNQGDMDISLLGMRYLQGFSRMEFVGQKLILSR